MANPNPQSFWACFSTTCTVTAFGEAEKLVGQTYTRCPGCKGIAERTTEHQWKACRIAYLQILCRKPTDLWAQA